MMMTVRDDREVAVCVQVPVATRAAPWVKWAGGKRRMVPVLAPFVPKTFGTYYEPFVGGGAMFYGLRPERAVLGDTNPELINAYTVVRDDVDELVAELRTHHHDEAHFYEVRALDPTKLGPVERAARFIFLNKTCFNGLYRVNRAGRFNVPFGKYTAPLICDEPNLHACSTMLKEVAIHRQPFERVLDRAVAADFVYFDPPYLPLSATSSFTGYTQDGFGLADHRRLRDVAAMLKARGVHVVISNSAAPAIRELSAVGFEVSDVQGARSINSKGDGRGKVAELIIR